jgi:putative transposase
MTDDKIALRALLEKSSDAIFLRDMIDFAAHRLMELDVDGLCGAGHGERSPERVNQRNGYRDRDWHTRVGLPQDWGSTAENRYAQARFSR